MRVTGNRLIDLATGATAKGQSALGAAGDQMSSGLRVRQPSDDPDAWLAAQRAALRRTLAEGANQAVQTSRDRMAETDAALATIGDAVSQARLLTLQGASATYDPTARAQLAVGVRAMFDKVLAAANTRASDGEYLLAGSTSLTTPFTPAGVYTGDAIQRAVPTLESGSAIAAITGAELTAAHGVDVLPLLDRVATALATNNLPAIQVGLGDLDVAIKQISLGRTRTGGAQSVLDATSGAHDLLVDNLDRAVSRQVEADGVMAATELAKATQAFEAARAVSAHIVRIIGARSA
jgi:flagellar hook-associated protein 3 FlgL